MILPDYFSSQLLQSLKKIELIPTQVQTKIPVNQSYIVTMKILKEYCPTQTQGAWFTTH